MLLLDTPPPWKGVDSTIAWNLGSLTNVLIFRLLVATVQYKKGGCSAYPYHTEYSGDRRMQPLPSGN